MLFFYAIPPESGLYQDSPEKREKGGRTGGGGGGVSSRGNSSSASAQNGPFPFLSFFNVVER